MILVDDGLATGATMRSAMAAVRRQKPARLVVAVPVAPLRTVARLREEADEVVCPATPEPFFSIGRWYADFAPVTDEEVRVLLEQAWREQPEWQRFLLDTRSHGETMYPLCDSDEAPLVGIESKRSDRHSRSWSSSP